MPVTPTYPGVYIQEISSGVRTITGVATSITAFIGRALRVLVNEPVTINHFGDFERTFGGLWSESPMSYAVRDFYLNGSGQAIIVRLFAPTDDELQKAQDQARKEAETAAQKVIGAANTANTNPKAGTTADEIAKEAEAAVDAAGQPSAAARSAARAVVKEPAATTPEALLIPSDFVVGAKPVHARG